MFSTIEAAVSKLSKEKQHRLVVRGGRYMAMATQLGASPVAGYYLGYFLDQYFGTTWLKPVCAVVALLGSLLGLIKEILRDQKVEQRAERKEK